MGGKSRKSGGVSRKLIDQLTSMQKARGTTPSPKRGKANVKNNTQPKGLFDLTE